MKLWLQKKRALGILPKLPKLTSPLGLFAAIGLCFLITAAVPVEAYGQRSRSSRPSRQKTTQKKTTQKKKATTPPQKKQGWKDQKNTQKKGFNSNSKGKTGTRSQKLSKKEAKQKTASEKALHERAKKQGTHFNSRSEASKSFKDKKGAEIAKKHPTTFASKPTTRPDYIPNNATVGGNTYNVTYNQSRGGYGYMGALGTFIMYDMMTDALFMDRQMQSHGYAYGQPRVYQSAGNVGWFFWTMGLLVIVIAIFAIVILRRT